MSSGALGKTKKCYVSADRDAPAERALGQAVLSWPVSALPKAPLGPHEGFLREAAKESQLLKTSRCRIAGQRSPPSPF